MEDTETLKAEITRLKAELAEVKAVSNQYLQNVAHQLTAPLGAIKWSIEALKDDRIPIGRKKTLLSSIYSQATILVHLIKNFALMSNLEADHELGQFREKPEPVNMMRLAINLANDFQPQAYESEIKIVVEDQTFQDVFSSNELKIEKNMVSQAISNIIENAVKYADPHSRITMSAVTTKNKDVGIAVESIGIPIAGADEASVFERGFRGHSAMQKVAAGTGIGLYLASRVMAFHHGRIALETNKKITRFAVLFPSHLLVSRT
ncbi:MAG: HAMP domain-containing sensor histidine kinase [Candidatus Binatia bacterium]